MLVNYFPLPLDLPEDVRIDLRIQSNLFSRLLDDVHPANPSADDEIPGQANNPSSGMGYFDAGYGFDA